jgi:CBS-domain-containing membrane protein
MNDMKQHDLALVLAPMLARDLMSPNPVSINADASVAEATAMLTDRGFGAAPVIDEAGRPIGVVSRADILVHDRERMTHHTAVTQPVTVEGFSLEEVDPTPVSDIMTPVVFAVPLETSAEQVVAHMLSLHVHQLFVVDSAGALVGVISTLDILRRLKRQSR